MIDAMKLLSVVIPVYNEEATIETVVRSVLSVPLPAPLAEVEILAVDDGSTDRTANVLQSLASDPRVRLFQHPCNRGKGAALRTGLVQARGALVIVQDADLEYHPEDYTGLLSPLLEGRASVVYGSRFQVPNSSLSWSSRLGNWAATACFNLLFGTRLTDLETCYKAFVRSAADSGELRCDRWGVDPELTARFVRSGLPIIEVPIRYTPRGYPWIP